jgi:type I restriction enzyme M protein
LERIKQEREPRTGQGAARVNHLDYTYDELLARNKVSVDIFWLRDKTLEDSASLPDSDVLATEIVQDLQAALAQFAAIAAELGAEADLDEAPVQ